MVAQVSHAPQLGRVVATWRDRLATGVMLVSGAGAFVAFVGAIAATRSAGPDTQVVEAWRMLGFLAFTGLCLLCALRPRQAPGAWKMVIFHKAAIAFVALTFLGGARDTGTVVAIDGAMALMVAVAYLLARGYTSWAALRERR